ncbi:MAG: arylsulfatase A-like enzyme/4-amino-4-deoxy-L-arabinose transferase-like glycosyltransferase [Planctomycetota bacterium]|jgi:arylsulfatase A-like enzyme/4-amino-4-deoxy-L-arabinose transferase-like glycosyltransferase
MADSHTGADSPRTLRILMLLVLCSGAMKLALLLPSSEALPAVDERLYLQGAQHLAAKGTIRYRNRYWDEAHASPVQPYLISACYNLFGEGMHQHVVRAIQVILSSLSVLLVFFITNRAFHKRLALIAAGVVAFYPALVAYTQYFFSETIYLFFMLSVLAILAGGGKEISSKRAFIAGLVGGLAALTRSVFVTQLPLLILWLLLSDGKATRRRFWSALALTMGTALVILPWSIRNTTRYGHFLLIDSNAGNVLYKNLNAVRPENHDIGQRVKRHEELNDLKGDVPYRDRVQEDNIALTNQKEVRAAITFVFEHPLRYLRNTGIRIFEMFNPTSAAVTKARTGRYPALPPLIAELIVAATLLSAMAALFFGLLGLFHRPPNKARALMQTAIFGHALICILVISGSRYRLPIMPLLIPFAVYGALSWKSNLGTQRSMMRVAFIGPVLAGLIACFIHFIPFSYEKGEADEFAARAPGANVLLISIDSLRADHLGCYGYSRDTSPSIDALAAEGTVFLNTIAQAPWTLPSHASLLTSLYPRAHNATDGKRRMVRKVTTMARALRGEGYDTRAIVSGPFMQKKFGLDRGFDVYDDSNAGGGHQESYGAITSPDINEKAVQALAAVQEPFFMFLHYWDVHYDYLPPAPFDTKFDPDYTGSIHSDDFIRNPSVTDEMSERDLEHVIALYDGEIGWVDQHIGALIAELKKRELFENTLIVLTSGNGDEFFEHGEKGHDHSLYDELLKVPLVMRVPGLESAGVKPARVQSIDIMPTIMELVGVSIPSSVHGHSLVPLLVGGAWEERPAFSENRMTRKSRTEEERIQAWCVYEGSWKLILYEGDRYPTELYDLESDPHETTNLLGTVDSSPFEQLIEAWKVRRPSLMSNFHKGVDPKTRRELRGLGNAGEDKEE